MTCKKLEKMYQTEEILFDELDSFGIQYTNEQTLFNSPTLFDFESICVLEESFKDTETTKRIRKQVSITVSIPSKLVKEAILLCTSDTHHLVTCCISAHEILALQKKLE